MSFLLRNLKMLFHIYWKFLKKATCSLRLGPETYGELVKMYWQNYKLFIKMFGLFEFAVTE